MIRPLAHLFGASSSFPEDRSPCMHLPVFPEELYRTGYRFHKLITFASTVRFPGTEWKSVKDKTTNVQPANEIEGECSHSKLLASSSSYIVDVDCE